MRNSFTHLMVSVGERSQILETRSVPDLFFLYTLKPSPPVACRRRSEGLPPDPGLASERIGRAGEGINIHVHTHQ